MIKIINRNNFNDLKNLVDYEQVYILYLENGFILNLKNLDKLKFIRISGVNSNSIINLSNLKNLKNITSERSIFTILLGNELLNLKSVVIDDYCELVNNYNYKNIIKKNDNFILNQTYLKNSDIVFNNDKNINFITDEIIKIKVLHLLNVKSVRIKANFELLETLIIRSDDIFRINLNGSKFPALKVLIIKCNNLAEFLCDYTFSILETLIVNSNILEMLTLKFYKQNRFKIFNVFNNTKLSSGFLSVIPLDDENIYSDRISLALRKRAIITN